MTDIRKVRPIAPLDAVPEDFSDGVRWWHVRGKRDNLTNDEFAAHFMPAELFDAVLDAARALCEAMAKPLAPFPYTEGAVLAEAIRAFDAYGQTS